MLFAAGYRRDDRHDAALPIPRGIDDGSLPDAIVLDHVLAETLNGLAARTGHDAAVDFLDRLEATARDGVTALNADAFASATSLFRQDRGLSFVDACTAAFMLTTGVEYLYAFDAEFDALEHIHRLTSAATPVDPEERLERGPGRTRQPRVVRDR